MSPYKPKGSNIWHVRFTTPGGERIRRSAGTTDKAQAREYQDTLKAEAWRQDKLGAKPSKTWDQAALQWLKDKASKADIENDKLKLRWLSPFLRGKRLEQIDRPLLERIKATKAEETSKSTANHMLALVRAILRRARDVWEWVVKIPTITLYQVDNKRVRWLAREQAQALLDALPDHAAELARMALATGLRKSNVFGLEWSQLDMQRRVAWIHASQAKGKVGIPVPLNEDALAVIRRQIGKHQVRVFTFKGKPLNTVDGATWKAALKMADIEDFHWHDLRHTWATWHIIDGTPIEVLQQLGGWKNLDMVLRYAHMSPNHLAKFARNSEITGKNLAKCKKVSLDIAKA